MTAFGEAQLEGFRDAVQTLKLYRRAEIVDERAGGKNVIEKLYVDPLPQQHVLQTMLKPNTTLLVGRKGTGKSTILQRLQQNLLKDDAKVCSYLDIKTVYESSQINSSDLEAIAAQNTGASVSTVRHVLLMRTFMRAVVKGIRDDLEKQLSGSKLARLKNAFTGSVTELLGDLDDFLSDLDSASFIDVTGYAVVKNSNEGKAERSSSEGIEAGVSSGKPNVKVDAKGSELSSTTNKEDFASVLVRDLNVTTLILELKKILEPIGVKHLFLLIDDFSELPIDAMEVVVDALLGPLNNWSEELVKLKIAAYPGRVYYGPIDRSKIDELQLDMYDLYGRGSVSSMEERATAATERLVETRLKHFGVQLSDFVRVGTSMDGVWRQLFFATLGNPRTLGYILFFLYEMQLIHGEPISNAGIRRAARRYYEEKVEQYFFVGKFLHESFEERASIYSLKELMEMLLSKARELRYYEVEEATWRGRGPGGRPPTSHFYISPQFEPLLSTLELNFFVSKYFSMSDRGGNKVSIYALNYGLCQRASIEFGRAADDRVYFVRRAFDYNPVMQLFVSKNQEIRCDSCGSTFDHSTLEALRMYHMKCPQCPGGTCRVVNIARRYRELLEEVDENSLLPATELGILRTLEDRNEPLYAGDIAGELDCSPQLVGWRSKKLAERDLVEREYVKGRRQYTPTELARTIYFSDNDDARV